MFDAWSGWIGFVELCVALPWLLILLMILGAALSELGDQKQAVYAAKRIFQVCRICNVLIRF
jgi:hypothetical protein